MQSRLAPCKICGQMIDPYRLGLHMYKVHGHRRQRKTLVESNAAVAGIAESRSQYPTAPVAPITLNQLPVYTDAAKLVASIADFLEAVARYLKQGGPVRIVTQ